MLTLFFAQSWPPWSSTIDRRMKRPMPSPGALVSVERLENLAQTVARQTGAMISDRNLNRAGAICYARTLTLCSCAVPSLIASNALINRLRTTCCNCTLSPRTLGKSPWHSS